MVTLPGLVPVHLHGPLGTEPVHATSDPSALAIAITCFATFRPSFSPALVRLESRLDQERIIIRAAKVHVF